MTSTNALSPTPNAFLVFLSFWPDVCIARKRSTIATFLSVNDGGVLPSLILYKLRFVCNSRYTSHLSRFFLPRERVPRASNDVYLPDFTSREQLSIRFFTCRSPFRISYFTRTQRLVHIAYRLCFRIPSRRAEPMEARKGRALIARGFLR